MATNSEKGVSPLRASISSITSIFNPDEGGQRQTQTTAWRLNIWEQVLDGNLETSGGAGTGGLVLPALCVTGPAGGGAGMYNVSIAWRGTASITNSVNNPCGALSGNYGGALEFRRIIQVPTFIDPNA